MKDMKAIAASVLETIKKMDPDPLPGDVSEAWGDTLKHVVLFQAGEIERLQIIVNKLEKTEDGVPITPDMQLWQMDKRHRMASVNCGKPWKCGDGWSFQRIQNLPVYSTEETASAAGEK